MTHQPPTPGARPGGRALRAPVPTTPEPQQQPRYGSNSDARKRHQPTAGPVDAIRGDWDGSERDHDSALRARVRTITAELLTRRGYWASRPGEIDAARGVAYQSAAGLLQRALEDTQ